MTGANGIQEWLFDGPKPASTVANVLELRHYLGATSRGWAYTDDNGVIVVSMPTSRNLPNDGSWLELTRWCITGGGPNAGSMQWAGAVRWLRCHFPDATTIVSYSDPSAGHSGGLYRSCGWLWAPTWHRLRPPPGTGNGNRGRTSR